VKNRDEIIVQMVLRIDRRMICLRVQNGEKGEEVGEDYIGVE
jgi:hypothetical protein